MVVAGEAWQWKDLKFWGLSLSGIRTCIAMPELSLCFDVAQGYPFTLHLKNYFITHGHLDHAAGIPYIISQKAMNSERPGRFFMPESLIQPLTEIMKLWEKIEKHEYKYEFLPVNKSWEYEINPQYVMRAFETVHRIESFGYTLIHKNKKLKPEFQNKDQQELRDLKSRGTVIDQQADTPLVSFTGDTQIEFLDLTPEVKKSKVLILESTYLDSKKSIEHAKKWGHTHLDEIIPRLKDIEAEKIVIIHTSSRYSMKEAQELLSQTLPAHEKERVVLFPGR